MDYLLCISYTTFFLAAVTITGLAGFCSGISGMLSKRKGSWMTVCVISSVNVAVSGLLSVILFRIESPDPQLLMIICFLTASIDIIGAAILFVLLLEKKKQPS
jgi:hypothetical protein